jgi:hypothetical protein
MDAVQKKKNVEPDDPLLSKVILDYPRLSQVIPGYPRLSQVIPDFLSIRPMRTAALAMQDKQESLF